MSRAVLSLTLTRDPRTAESERTESERLLAEAEEAVRKAREAQARIRRMNTIYRERLEGVRQPND